MKFEEFSQRVKVLEAVEGDNLRTRYISSFVNEESEWYKKYIAIKVQYDDGQYYPGVLWDSLKQGVPVKEEQIQKQLRNMNEFVYVLWDISSRQFLKPKDFWKFPRDAVLYLRATDLTEGSEYLPEDIYIFDASFSWSLIFTHETTCDNERLCYEAVAS